MYIVHAKNVWARHWLTKRLITIITMLERGIELKDIVNNIIRFLFILLGCGIISYVVITLFGLLDDGEDFDRLDNDYDFDDFV